MSNEINIALHPKQSMAYQSEASEILYGGAAGGGKSHLMRAAAILWAAMIPKLQVYIFRRTSVDLWKNHMLGPSGFPGLLANWIESKRVKINYSKNYIDFWNGSKINLCYCQYEKDVYDFQGAEIHVLMIDELTQWLKSMYTFLRSRVRMVGIKLPQQFKGLFPRILNGANPGGIGHNWVKEDFIKSAKPLDIVSQPKEEGGMRRQFIPALLEDNPSMEKEDPNYEGRLYGLGSPALVKAMRWGDWDIVAGGAVDDVWNPDKHIIPVFEIPSSWWIDRSFDWGSSHPFSVGWWAESDGTEATMPDGEKKIYPPRTLFRICELYGWTGKANQGTRKLAIDIGREIKEIEKKSPILKSRIIRPGPADTQIYQMQNGMCLADDMAKAGVTWTRADKSPGSRQTGLEVVRRMLMAGLTYPMEEPGLFVFENCLQFIRTIPVLPRDTKKPDEIDSDAEDHVFDETSYRVRAKKMIATSSEFLI